MYIKIEIVHEGESEVHEGNGFVDAWKAIRDAGGVLADHTAAELNMRTQSVEDLADQLRHQNGG